MKIDLASLMQSLMKLIDANIYFYQPNDVYIILILIQSLLR